MSYLKRRRLCEKTNREIVEIFDESQGWVRTTDVYIYEDGHSTIDPVTGNETTPRTLIKIK